MGGRTESPSTAEPPSVRNAHRAVPGSPTAPAKRTERRSTSPAARPTTERVARWRGATRSASAEPNAGRRSPAAASDPAPSDAVTGAGASADVLGSEAMVRDLQLLDGHVVRFDGELG